ncbi:MAG: alkaline phosphatase D family protein [Pseudomonadota bacterium]
MKTITRRTALTAGLAAGAASCAGAPKMTPYTAASVKADGVFAHGVASGDPDHTSVVLWTRLSELDGAVASYEWEIAETPDFAQLAGRGVGTTSAARDWTVKEVASALEPGKSYFYRFKAAGAISSTGRTRTLPKGETQRARFAVVSCSNFPFGYFNVYDLIARREDLDAVIHLGDYIYEYGPDGYGGEAGEQLGRPHDPPREIVNLDDYRRRHAQYKADPSAQAMHAAHPLIAIWDDHETTNNSWKDGAQNHQSTSEGDWAARKRAALQAYYEWMPVRDPRAGTAPESLFRAYSYGDLLTLTAIETRLMARSQQFEYSEVTPTLQSAGDVANFRDNILYDQSREMLGRAQLDFIGDTLRSSVNAEQPWRLIANQIIMAEVIAPDLTPHVTEEDIVALEKQWDQARAFIEFSKLGLPTNLDAWDGYPAARERFYDLVRETGADGVVVLTGDTHTWWANDLKARDGANMGVELGVNSVTSPSPYRKEFLGGKGAEYALLTNQKNKSVRYLSGENHGYISVDVTPDAVNAEFMAVDTIETPSYNGFKKAAFKIGKSSGFPKFRSAKGVSFKEQWLF